METNENKITKEQVYAKYVLIAKRRLDEENLAKKQNKLSGWLLVLWLILIVITLLVYFWISGFSVQGFRELTDGSLGYWTFAGVVFLAMIFVLVIVTRKPNFVNINDIFKKADELIKEKRKNLKTTAEEISLLEIKEDNEL